MCDIKRPNVKRNVPRLSLRGVALALFTAWQLFGLWLLSRGKTFTLYLQFCFFKTI